MLLGTAILITTALLANAFILQTNLDTIFDRSYAEMNGSQICCLWNNETISADIIRQYLNSRQNELTYQITDKTKTMDYIEKDGVKLSNGILMELPETMDHDTLSPRMPDNGPPETPGQNEIWVTTKTANILALKPGDPVVLQLADQSVEVTVARIVTDPVFGGSSNNVYRMWCGPGQLSDFPLAENHAVSCLEIRFKEYNPQTEHRFIRDAEEYFDAPLADTIYTYDRIKSGYTAPYQMVGAALCFVSVILAAAITALTLFLIRSDIDEDVRNIAIYKSLGMSGAQIMGIYLGCYEIIGIIGVSSGSLLGGTLSKRIIANILGDIGLYTVSFPEIGTYQFCAAILILAAVTVICFCAVFKVRRLNASYAVRTGSWQTAERSYKRPKKSYCHGSVSFELYYAVRGIQNKKLRYIYIAGVSLILGCLAVICLGCLNAVGNIDQEPEIWGFIKSDIYVTSLENARASSIIEELEKDPQIRYAYGVNKITSQYKPGNRDTWQNIAAEVYELPWKEEIKDRSLYGRRPVRENEVGIGLALAREYELEVGEEMELMVNGKKKTYKITGIFQTLSNYGNIIRMVTDDLDQFVEADSAYADYMLVLTDSSKKWEYAEELAKRYDGKFSFIASKSNGENISGILAPAIGTILSVLLAVTLLITLNLTFLLIRRDQKLIGLLKAAGMTSWQIVKIYSLRNGLAALAGNSLGLILGIFVIPKLLTPYTRLLGLSEFPFANSLAGTAACFLLLPVCIVLGTYAVAKAISQVSVKRLVNE